MQKSKKLEIEAVKTSIITSKDNLLEVLKTSLKKHPLKEKDILVVTSKVVAITQGKLIKITSKKDFERLVHKEADEVIGGKEATLTLKNGIFIAWAGIDRSNIPQGYAVLWPKTPYKVAADLHKNLKKHFKIEKLGILISDSCCTPLRRGISGVTLGYAGFQGVNDLRGNKDLYGKKLKVTQQAIADNLVTAAHLVMGESNESTPLVIMRNAPIIFTNRNINPQNLIIKKEKCLFKPLYSKI